MSPGPGSLASKQQVTPDNRLNNFDALRLALAGLVVIFHLVVLSGMPASDSLVDALAMGAQLAIQGFFVISGYLVFASYERSTRFADYVEKRVRRLGPGYSVVVTAAALTALMVVPEARADVVSVGRYLAANLVFLNFLAPTLPGVFEQNPLPEVNGALWTLKVEVMFYLTVPVLAWVLAKCASPHRPLLVMAAIYLGAELWRELLTWYATTGVGGIWSRLPHQLPGQMSFFISGVAMLRYREVVLERPGLLLTASLVLTAVSLAPSLLWLRALGLSGLVMWTAFAAPVHVPAARYGDLSYGVYILHCPIIQVFFAAGLFGVSSWIGAAAAITAVVVAAFVLWWTVEKPALRRDSHYRTASAKK